MKKLLKLLSATLLTVLTAVMLLACAPADLDKAEEKLEEAGYTIISNVESNEDGVVGSITAMKGLIGGDMIIAILYENAKDAKEAKENYDEEVEDGEGVYQTGKWLIIATEDAYEDFVA